jgi:hypothetical protein
LAIISVCSAAFDAMHKDAARRRFDVVMAWSVDRLGRSLQDLISFMQERRSLKIDLSTRGLGDAVALLWCKAVVQKAPKN